MPDMPDSIEKLSFHQALRACSEQVDAELDKILSVADAPEKRIVEAMRYAVFNGGKRLRPFLVLQSAALFGVDPKPAARAAAAIELVHCYSLVHDDLPAMDDDDLRRGQPTLHVQFDEATAILAGDALLTLAFEVLADERTHASPHIRADLVLRLSKAAGARGMVGGQMIDLAAPGLEMDIGAITRLQRLKTGALIEWACLAGGVLGAASKPAKDALRGYSKDLGLAFQITDDLLDVEGDEEVAGKALRKDEDQGKATFVSILGIDRAKHQAGLLVEQAVEHLAIFDHKGDGLRDAARFVLSRRS